MLATSGGDRRDGAELTLLGRRPGATVPEGLLRITQRVLVHSSDAQMP